MLSVWMCDVVRMDVWYAVRIEVWYDVSVNVIYIVREDV